MNIFRVTKVKFFEERETIRNNNQVIVVERNNVGTRERGQS
jgi:hypothetical protein